MIAHKLSLLRNFIRIISILNIYHFLSNIYLRIHLKNNEFRYNISN